jgi:hypothetical protein
MVRLTNPQPAILPGFLGYLGPFRFDLFVSELEHDRVVPDPYFSGLRLNFRPAPWLEVGLSRTATFGGDGRPDVDFDDFLTIIGGENLGGDEDTSNQVASVDARLLLPFLWNAELYGELGGEDEAGGFIAKKAYLAGLYLPRLEPSGRLALRLEYANLDADRAGTLWYTHGIYRSGYVYEGQILGHHAGGDATDFYAELQAFLPRDVTVTASLDIEERGRAGAVQEEHTQPALALNLALPDGLTLELAYAWDRVRNFGFTAGDDRDFHLLKIGMAKRW